MKEKEKKTHNVFYHSVRKKKTFLRWIIVTKEEKEKKYICYNNSCQIDDTYIHIYISCDE